MRKWMRGCLILTMAVVLAGCGEGEEKRNVQSTSNVKDILNGQMSENAEKLKKENGQAAQEKTQTSEVNANATTSAEQTEVASKEPSKTSGQEVTQGTADVDLTTLSSTLVYSEVYNMMVSPDEYVGKTIKMQGSFQYFRDEMTGNEYFSCLIKDATACCAQGIEFVLAGDYVYPNDYPEINSEITVYGIFDTYMEGEYMYCTLRNAQLLTSGKQTQG